MPVTLKALRKKEFDFDPQTLGEHIKKRRLELKLTQQEVARLLGVDLSTILNWEKGYTEPLVESMPTILRFLGYNPFPKPKKLSECLSAKRKAMGWSIAEAARQFGIDEGTWASWEHNQTTPRGQRDTDLKHFLDLTGAGTVGEFT